VCCSVLQCAAVCCSVLQCVAVCCSVFQCVAVCCSVLQCVAVCCSVLQCVAVWDQKCQEPGLRVLHPSCRCMNVWMHVWMHVYTWMCVRMCVCCVGIAVIISMYGCIMSMYEYIHVDGCMHAIVCVYVCTCGWCRFICIGVFVSI